MCARDAGKGSSLSVLLKVSFVPVPFMESSVVIGLFIRRFVSGLSVLLLWLLVLGQYHFTTSTDPSKPSLKLPLFFVVGLVLLVSQGPLRENLLDNSEF